MILFLHNNFKYAHECIQLLKDNDYKHFSSSDRVYTFPQYTIGIGFLYPYLIPKKELVHPWFNFHPGPLPQYGGRNLCYHAIMNKEKEFGATIHYMDENFDTGPIIEMSKFPIRDRTAGELFERTCEELVHLFNKYLDDYTTKTLITYPAHPINYYKKTKINEYIDLTEEQKINIRALTTDKYHAKIQIDDSVYEVRKV